MNLLKIVLCIKIIFTLIVYVYPFLTFSKEKLEKMLNSKFETTAIIRLYGISLLALLVGYGSGLYSIFANNQFPIAVVLMGIVSNGGVALFFLITKTVARSKIPFIFAFSMTLLLAVCLFLKN
jgi:hypothetical protein